MRPLAALLARTTCLSALILAFAAIVTVTVATMMARAFFFLFAFGCGSIRHSGRLREAMG